MPPAVRAQIEAARQKAIQTSSADAAGDYAMVLHSYELLEAALPCYQRAQALDPASDRWPYYLGLVYEFSQRPAEAAKWFALAAAKRPQDAVVQLRLADAREAAGDRAGSAQALQPLLASGQVPEQVQLRLGRLAEADQKFADAVKHYDAALQAAPSFKNALLGLSRAHRRLGNLEAASQATQRISAEAPQPSLEDTFANRMLDRNLSVQGHLRRCTTFKAHGRVEQATLECEAALAAEPKSFAAHGHLVALYAVQRLWDRAREHYEKAITLDAAAASLHLEYANVLVAQGQLPQAIVVLEKSLAANRSLPAAHTLMGQIQVVHGNPRRAEAEFREALDLKPNDALTRDALGTLLASQKRYADALPLLAAENPTRTLPARRALAATRLALGHHAEALAAYQALRVALLLEAPSAEREMVERQIAALSGKSTAPGTTAPGLPAHSVQLYPVLTSQKQ